MSELHQYYLDDKFCEREISNRFNENLWISVELRTLLVKLHAHPEEYHPSLFNQFGLKEICTYLKASHVYYLNSWLPKINQTTNQLKSGCGNDFLTIRVLILFLEKYQVELEQHIAYEEQVLFDFVSEMINGKYTCGKKDFVISHFLFTHNNNVIVHLQELKNDLMKFESGLKENMIFQVLFNQLEIFQNDLLVHGLIEDEVFIPKVLDYIHDNFEKLERL